MNVLFVTPSEVSSGEAVTALHMADTLVAEGCKVHFVASNFTAGFLAGRGPMTVLGPDLLHNQSSWNQALLEFRPDRIVFADYPLLAFDSGTVSLRDAAWEAGLARIDADLYTLDHLGYAQGQKLIFFGPPQNTLGLQRIPSLPSGIHILLPCPLHHPDTTMLRGRPFRYSSFKPDRNHIESGNIRRSYVRSPDEVLVLHLTSQWACRAAKMIGHPYYPLLPKLLSNSLEDIASSVTVLSVNDGSLLPEITEGKVRILNLKPMSPAAYEGLLLASDLIITENRISVSLGKAIGFLRPCAVLHNSFSVLDTLQDGAGREIARMMEQAQLGSVFPFEVFPIWSRTDLEQLGIFDAGCLQGAFETIEIFDGGSAATQFQRLLGDTYLRENMRAAQVAYLRRLESLPGPRQALDHAPSEAFTGRSSL